MLEADGHYRTKVMVGGVPLTMVLKINGSIYRRRLFWIPGSLEDNRLHQMQCNWGAVPCVPWSACVCVCVHVCMYAPF